MNELIARLEDLAARGQTITYGALARELAMPGPGAIAKLTAKLEALMEEDAARGRPFRAVLCAGRLANGLPAQGFFEKAAELGRYNGSDPDAFCASERAKLSQS